MATKRKSKRGTGKEFIAMPDLSREAEKFLGTPMLFMSQKELSSNNQRSAELWCDKILQYPLLRENHEHVILVYTLSPLLYGKIKQPEKWLNWAKHFRLFGIKSDEATLIKPLTEKEMTAVETIEMAHNLFSTKLKECGRSFLKEMLDLTSYVDLHEKMEESFKRAVVNKNFNIMTNELKDDLKSNDLTFNYVAGAMFLSLLQYCQHVRKYCLDNKNEADLFQKEKKSNEKESDKVRRKGINECKDGRYKAACQKYTSAINRDRYNERLYCNRALTYLKTKDFAKAASDGKRAIILKAAWPKSQYRYAEGLFCMERFHKAYEANLKAISLCKENDCPPSELRDLELQRDNFYEALSEFNLLPLKPESVVKKEEDGDDDDEYTDADDADGDDDFDGAPDLVEQGSSDEECDSDDKPCADNRPPLVEVETDSDSDDNYPQYSSDDKINDVDFVSFLFTKKDRYDIDLEELLRLRTMHAERENSNKDDDLREKKRQPQEFTKIPSKGFDEKEATEEDWHLKVQEHFKEASEELLQDRPRFAVKSFREAFYIMDTQLKNYEYEELDIVVSIYAYGVACLETAQVQELEIALEKFDCIILEHETIVFPLAYYGKGRVYIKQNRFSEALVQLRDGLLILQRQAHQNGVIRWPGTKHIIEESDTKKMKEAFEINIEICKSPPQPDAVCRCHDPSSNTKIDIYFSDPDFKGFVRTQCHEHCKLEFHPSCWKKIKHQNVEKAQDKNYLGKHCFTPDCDAVIVSIVIFSQDGLKRTEFTGEKPERKPKNAVAKAVKVKAYSEKKLEKRSKKEIKMEKKRLAKENRDKQNNDDNDDDANILESKLLLGASNANWPTSRPLSSVSNNVINSSSNSPGTPDSPNQLTPFEIGYVLKKEEIQDDQALGAHAKPVKTKSKKKKQKNVQTLDLFHGKKAGDVDLEDEDGSRQRSFNMLDENSPFAVPEQLLTEAPMFERRRANIAPVVAPPPMTEEERKAEEQLRDSLFSYFAQILEKHGPLQVEDPVLVSGFYEIFPPEAHKLVTRWGNLSNFLLQSLQFAMVDDMVCLLKDSVRCRELVRQKTGTPNPDGKSNLKPLNGKASSASVENTQGAAFINQSANLSSENFPNLSAVHAANKGSNGKRTSRSNNSNHSTSNQSMNSAINPKIDVKTSKFPTLDKLSDIVFDGRKGNSKEAISELSSFEAIGNSFRESKGHADTMPEFALTKGSNGSVPYQNVAAAELPIGNISLQQRASNHLTMSTSHLKYNASDDMSHFDRCDSGIHVETPNPPEDKIPNFSLLVASHVAEDNSIREEFSESTGVVSDINDLHLSMLTSGDSFLHSYPQTGKRSKRDFSVQVVFHPYVKSIAVNTDGTALYKQKQFDKLSRENQYLQMQLQDKLHQLERSKNKCQVLQKTLADSKDMEKVLQATNREILLQHDSETRKRDKEFKEKSDLIEKLQQQEKTAREQKEKSNWMSERLKFEELKATIEESYKKATQRAKDAEIMVLELQLKADCEPYEVKQKESEYYHRHFNTMAERPSTVAGMSLDEVKQQCKTLAVLWKQFSEEVQNKIVEIKGYHHDRVEMINKGSSLSSLPTVELPTMPEPPAALFHNPMLKNLLGMSGNPGPGAIFGRSTPTSASTPPATPSPTPQQSGASNGVDRAAAVQPVAKVPQNIPAETKVAATGAVSEPAAVGCSRVAPQLQQQKPTAAATGQQQQPQPVPPQQQQEQLNSQQQQQQQPFLHPQQPHQLQQTQQQLQQRHMQQKQQHFQQMQQQQQQQQQQQHQQHMPQAQQQPQPQQQQQPQTHPPPKNSFEKIMRKLLTMYPLYNKIQLTNFIKDVRSSNNNSLSSLSLDEIIHRVSELTKKDQLATQMATSPRLAMQMPAHPAHPAPNQVPPPMPGPVQSVPAQRVVKPVPVLAPAQIRPASVPPGIVVNTAMGVPSNAVPGNGVPQPSTVPTSAAVIQPPFKKGLPPQVVRPHSPYLPEPSLSNIGISLDDEDPCVICHDELTPGGLCVLECKHRFHTECIRKWMKEQSTCPTCRVHILLPEDFPSLSSTGIRQRQF